MFDHRVRRLIAPVLRRPAAWLARNGVSANQVTVVGFLLGAGAAALIATNRVWIGTVAWLLSRVLDGLDGALARAAGRATPFGGYLDITLDMAAYSLMAVGFAVIHPAHRLAWLLVLVGYVLAITSTAVLSSILERQRTQLDGNDRSLQFTPGLAESGETTAVYLLLAIFPAWAGPIVWTWIALLFATAAQRTLLARRLLDR